MMGAVWSLLHADDAGIAWWSPSALTKMIAIIVGEVC